MSVYFFFNYWTLIGGFITTVANALLLLKAPDSGIFTPYTFPLPDNFRCWQSYLNLHYACDPDQLLYYTYAQKIDKFFNYDKFAACRRSAADADADDPPQQYVVGIALAETMYHNNDSTNLEGCQQKHQGRNHSGTGKVKINDSVIDQILNGIAEILLLRWSTGSGSDNDKGHASDTNYCIYDILIFLTQTLIVCYSDERLLITDRPLIGVAFSDRLKGIIPAKRFSSALTTLKPTNDNPSTTTSSYVSLIIDSLQLLNQIVPYPHPWDEAAPSELNWIFPISEHELSDNNKTEDALSGKSKRHPTQVPVWALIVFLVCLTLTFICTALGHWVNTGDSRGKFTSSKGASLFARGHTNDRRWRAGFAGGMMDVHAQAKGAAVGGRGAGAGKAKGKMFGAMAMGNKKTNSSQYNYQKV